MAKRDNPSSDLMLSIKRSKWDRVGHYLSQANLADSRKTYPLHEACSDSQTPMKIVSDIYYAYPEAMLIKDSDHLTPILVAVECEFEDAVDFLVKACPEACTISNKLKTTPLHLAVYSLKSSNMIDSITIANPGAAFIPDQEGDSPFDIFFRQWNVLMRILVSNPISCESKILDCFIGHGSWKIRDIYKKACLLLKAANIHHKGKAHGESNYCIVQFVKNPAIGHFANCL